MFSSGHIIVIYSRPSSHDVHCVKVIRVRIRV